MNDAEQKEGEDRVMRCLVQPLRDLGLGVPSGMNRGEFDRMIRHVCATLARMTESELSDLKEWAVQHPGGKNRNQFPRALDLLRHAGTVAPPDDGDASPFVRRLMASRLGDEAMALGFGPEYLAHLRKHRGEAPGAWTMSKLRESADDARRRLENIELRMSRGEDVAPEDAAFRDQRRAAIARCEDIRAQARQEAAA